MAVSLSALRIGRALLSKNIIFSSGNPKSEISVFLENGFTCQTDFIVVQYSAASGVIPSNDRLRFQTTKLRSISM
jgi:hypothetical protein